MTIRLQLSRSTENTSALIAHICHSDFSHVDVVLPPDIAIQNAPIFGGELLGASNSPGVFVLAGNPNGVAIRPSDYQTFAIRRVLELRAEPAVEKRFYEVILSQLGEPFDNSAMHAFLNGRPQTGRDWRDASAWFCSELVVWSLEQAGFFPWEILVSKDRVSPGDLLLLTNWAVVNTATFWDEPK